MAAALALQKELFPIFQPVSQPSEYPLDYADVEGLKEALEEASKEEEELGKFNLNFSKWWEEHRDSLPKIVQEAVQDLWHTRRWSSWEEFYGCSCVEPDGTKRVYSEGLQKEYLKRITGVIRHIAIIEECTGKRIPSDKEEEYSVLSP